MSCVLGIDAGGTKTLALLADESGTVLAEARGSGANLRTHGEARVEKVLGELLSALEPPEPIAAACLGMAGVDRAHEKQRVQALMQRLGIDGAVRVENDAVVALYAGAPEGMGIVVVAGTGSIAYGVDSSGERVRSGGWGYLLGDEGSGFWLGRSAVRQGIRAAEGRGPETVLYRMICDRLGIETPARLLEWFYHPQRSRNRIAELAGLVEEAAAQGDAAAEALLDEAAEHLAAAALAVARKLDFGAPYPIVLAGGAFRACPSLMRRLEGLLELPAARLVRLEAEPALGAVRLAVELLRSGEESPG